MDCLLGPHMVFIDHFLLPMVIYRGRPRGAAPTHVDSMAFRAGMEPRPYDVSTFHFRAGTGARPYILEAFALEIFMHLSVP